MFPLNRAGRLKRTTTTPHKRFRGQTVYVEEYILLVLGGGNKKIGRKLLRRKDVQDVGARLVYATVVTR